MRLVFLFMSLAVWGQLPAFAQDGKRVALVVGVSQYKDLTPLSNSTRDATAIADVLESYGFATTRIVEPDAATFERALEAFKASSTNAEEAIVYYSGHGMTTLKDRKYVNVLAPIDASISCENLTSQNIMPMDRLISSVAHIGKQVIVFDSCRNDPFPACQSDQSTGRLRANGFDEVKLEKSIVSTGSFGPARGLSSSDPPRGFTPVVPSQRRQSTMVVYSTAANATASDGPAGKHSPFAQALIDELADDPKRPMAEMIDRVSKRVIETSSQRPFLAIDGGAPFLCMAGRGCRGVPELEREALVIAARKAVEEVKALVAARALHTALVRVRDEIGRLNQAAIDVPAELSNLLTQLVADTPALVRERPAGLSLLAKRSGSLVELEHSSSDGRFVQLKSRLTTPSSGLDRDAVQILDTKSGAVVFDTSGSVSLGVDYRLSGNGLRFVNCVHRNVLTPKASTTCTTFSQPTWSTPYTFDPQPGSTVGFVVSEAGDWAAFPYADTSGKPRAAIQLVPTVPSGEAATTLQLLPDELDGGTEHVTWPLIKFSPAGDEIAVLAPKRFYLFRKTGGTWQRQTLEGVYKNLSAPQCCNNNAALDVDFTTRRFALASVAYRPVVVYFGSSDGSGGGRLTLKHKVTLESCLDCSDPHFADQGRMLTLSRPGTPAWRLVSYALPDVPGPFNVHVFSDVQFVSSLLTEGGRKALALDGDTLTRMDLIRRPTSTSFTIKGFAFEPYSEQWVSERLFTLYGRATDSGRRRVALIDVKTQQVVAYRDVDDDLRVSGDASNGRGILAMGVIEAESPFVRLGADGKFTAVRVDKPHTKARASLVMFLDDPRYARVFWTAPSPTGVGLQQFLTVVDLETGQQVLSYPADEAKLEQSKWKTARQVITLPKVGTLLTDENRIVVSARPQTLEAMLKLASEILGEGAGAR